MNSSVNSSVFSRLDGHEQVVFADDPASGLRCIVAIHSTALGPSLGGTRFRPYPNDDAALADVLRLSRAMTLKNAAAGLDHGGGKGVIIGDPAVLRSEELFRAYGRVVQSLSGRYITACDVGTKPADMTVVHRETGWVTGMEESDGGSGDSGVFTAWGVYLGIRACLMHVYGNDSPADRHIAIQGIGKVGRRLAEHLAADGAQLTLADIDDRAVTALAGSLGAATTSTDRIHAVPCDVFSPNALGAGLNDTTIPELACQIVAGGANNQLAEDRHGQLLAERGVLYAPDFLINAGGVIQISDELHDGGYSQERARQRTSVIPDRLLEIFALAQAQGIDTTSAAKHWAETRISSKGDPLRFRSFR